MKEKIEAIAQRLSALREIMEVSPADMAANLDMSESEYLNYEAGNAEFNISFLYTAAAKLGVDITDLLSGESTKLSMYCLVRAGEGTIVQKKEEYEYKHLAALFKDKLFEPFFVTVSPTDTAAQSHKKSHEGHEFNYVLSGAMRVSIEDEELTLYPGDSLYFNSRYLHALQCVGEEPCRFLAIIEK